MALVAVQVNRLGKIRYFPQLRLTVAEEVELQLLRVLLVVLAVVDIVLQERSLVLLEIPLAHHHLKEIPVALLKELREYLHLAVAVVVLVL